MRAPPRWVVPAVMAWVVVAGGGILGLVEYAGRPGPRGEATSEWPDATRVTREPDKATLVMALHPHCPCSFASVSELARLLAAVPDRLSAHVLVVQPGEDGAAWTHTRSTNLAAAIPGVQVHADTDGTLARQFGAATSGHVTVYDESGRLRFSGGITAARGHEGDNAGRDGVLFVLADGDEHLLTTEVYGCELFGPAGTPCPCAGSTHE